MRFVAARAFRACQNNVRSRCTLSYDFYSFVSLPHLRAAHRTSLCLHNSAIAQISSHNSSSFSTSLPSQSFPRSPAGHAFKVKIGSRMNVRRSAAVLVSGLVAYGAWYTYNGNLTAIHPALARGPASSTASIISENAAPTRSILVIGADELQTATVVGEGPISKTTEADGRTVVEMLTPDQSTHKLRKMEESYLVNRGRGVLRYDIVQLASNSPIEDDHAEKIVDWSADASGGPDRDWMFWGVFDGHSGWTTSAKLRQSLINYVARELHDIHKTSKDTPDTDAIEAAIKKGFTRLDDEIVYHSVQEVLKSNSRSVAAELLAPALSGSCALLSFYDSESGLLRVACTGDSRAVLGRRSKGGKWAATPLSVDQTGSNQDEANRLRKLHPGEEHVIRNGRVLGGLEPTRAFGDASYKWTKDVANRLRESFFGRSPSPLLTTPPYVTAEPVLTTTKIYPEKGDFLVIATDGLWEMLTNEEVVGLVGKWLETQASKSSNSQFDSVWSKVFGVDKNGLPVERAAGSTQSDGQKTPIRMQQWGIPKDDQRFVVKDRNVATHLIRNALGGKNEEMVSALLTLPSPYSRRYRDDLTVEVVFFGNGERAPNQSQEVVINEDATAAPRAKL